MNFNQTPDVLIQEVKSLSDSKIRVYALREDLMHQAVSGNKFRKLKYNVQAFYEGNYRSILSFGGAYSNHISALATLTKENKIPTIAVIRGNELEEKIDDNPTLSYALECGTKLVFISRESYRKKNNVSFLKKLEAEFGNIFILPEGGTNELAVKGCEEILTKQTNQFDFICCPIGTAGTISGLVRAAGRHQTILGFPSLKETDWIQSEVSKFTTKTNYKIVKGYDFGGYAKVTPKLIAFINEFKHENNIPLDPIYTGKMVYGLRDLMHKKYLHRRSNVLFVHTGGLQGIKGINKKLEEKGLPLIC